MRGKTWIVHDEEAGAYVITRHHNRRPTFFLSIGEDNVSAVLERSALKISELGEFLRIDYRNIREDAREFPKIPNASIDLVTMNQGKREEEK